MIPSKPCLPHLLDPEWEQEARETYRTTYDEMRAIFRPRIDYGFYASHTSTKPDMREYLVRIIIDNLKLVRTHQAITRALGERGVGYWTSDRARTWERAGETVLLYTALFRDRFYAEAGKHSFQAAAAILRDHFGPVPREQRIPLNEELSDKFGTFVAVLRKSGLSETDMDHYFIRLLEEDATRL
jgi:hypothetical protein